MTFSLVPIDGEQPISQRSGYHLVSQTSFLFLAIYHLDAGKTEQQVAGVMQAKHHARFHTFLRRSVNEEDIKTARAIYNEMFPDAKLRACMARWALTLSKKFFLAITAVTDESAAQTQDTVDKVNALFQPYLAARTFHQGQGLRIKIDGEEIATSFAIYQAGPRRPFLTPEGAIFHWCQTVPYQKYGTSLWKHVDYQGQTSLVTALLTRCLEGQASLKSYVTDEQRKKEHEKGNESFWMLVEYLNWLVHHNPLDAS